MIYNVSLANRKLSRKIFKKQKIWLQELWQKSDHVIKSDNYINIFNNKIFFRLKEVILSKAKGWFHYHQHHFILIQHIFIDK